jgi:hypothetical protein
MTLTIDDKILNTFAKLFSGRVDAFGSVFGACVKEPVSNQTYYRHLVGNLSVGIYPLLPDGTCRWGAVDIDFDNFQQAITVVQKLIDLGIKYGIYIERSKSKGYHILLFVTDWVLAKDIRLIMRSALLAARLPETTELFPKQDSLHGIQYGNYLNLPYFGGDNPEGRRMILDMKTGNPIPLKQWLENVKIFPASEFRSISKKIPEPTQNLGRRENLSISGILGRPLQIGERRPTLIRLAGYLRYRYVSEEITLMLLQAWAKYTFADPLDPHEIEKHVRGIYRRYGFEAASSNEVVEILPDQIKTDIEGLWQ